MKTVNDGHLLRETQFGRVVSGLLPKTRQNKKANSNFHFLTDSVKGVMLKNMVAKCWRLEEDHMDCRRNSM